MTKLKQYILHFILVASFLAVVSCTDEQSVLPVAEGTPLTVTAEIGTRDSPSTRAVALNSYDRSDFIAGDGINVVCSRNGVQLASSGYTLNAAATAWAVTTGSPGLGFLPATTCRASFPVAYDGIRADQSAADGSAFLRSNYLLTPEVSVSGAEVNFTGDNAFGHGNVKLTLKFQGSGGVSLPAFSSITLQASGLRTGDATKVETIYPFRPDTGQHSWCAVIYPRAADTDITVTVMDEYSVTYKVVLRCAMQKSTSYTYTLKLRNDILVPVGNAEIEAWDLKVRHTGGFD